jgi:mannose-6-phosphate isomerase-like protein (cupin superfamily)
LSLQKHDKRGEFWFVVKGDGFLVYGDIEHRITEGSHVEIPVGMVHCLVNDTSEPLMVYEMQFGTCSEDDIVRLDDEYGRANDESLGMGCPRKICDVLPKGKKNA